MKVTDFKVGDKVYHLDFHYRSNFDNATIEEAEVVKVGRTYVTVKCDKHGGEYQFYVNNEWDGYLTMKINGGTANWLFRSMQDYEDYKEKRSLIRLIRNSVDYLNRYTVDELRKIGEILKGEN